MPASRATSPIRKYSLSGISSAGERFTNPSAKFSALFTSTSCTHQGTLILMSLLTGIHPVREALRAGRSLDRVMIAKGAGGPRLQELIDLCRERRISVRFEPREQLDRAAGKANHQGVVAFGATERFAEIEETASQGGLHVILDGVEDPHNLGAIVRTAHAAGASALVIPERRAAPLTDVAEKAAAGAVAYLPLVRIGNVNRALE